MIHISEDQLREIQRIVSEHQISGQIFVFGSRARGDHRKYSDLDLLIRADERFLPAKLERLKSAFKESTLPFEVDVVEWIVISDDFRKRIEPELAPLP